MRRILGVLAVAILAACAPGYAHIESAANGGDNTVTAITGARAVPTTWTLTTTHKTRRYTGASWTDTRTGGADGVSRNALTVTGSGTLNGTIGGTIYYFDGSTSWDDWHYRSGLKVEQGQWVTDRMTIINEGDAVKFQDGSEDSRFSRGWVNTTHDDCVQADYGTSAVLEQALFSDCYNGLSARPSGSIDASGHELFVDHSIVEVSDKDSCYHPETYGCPNHAGWLKWSGDGSTDLGFAANTSTFAALTYPEIGNLALNARVVTHVDTIDVTNAQACHDVTLDYMGSLTGSDGSAWADDVATWEAKCPTGLIVHTSATSPTAVEHYYAVSLAWHDAHDGGLG